MTTSGQTPDEQNLAEALQTAVLQIGPGTDSDDTGPSFSVPGHVESFRDDISGKDQEAKTGPPKIGEWQDFFARIVIRYGTDFYMNLMLRHIDPESLKPSDWAQLSITAEERISIARPFAELANKSKLTRKHGRMIVSSADSVESAILLMKWGRSVSKISKKYRKPKEQDRRRVLPRPHQHQPQQAQQATPPAASQNGTAHNGNIGSSALPQPSVILEPFSGS
jgi:hypothetical protein